MNLDGITKKTLYMEILRLIGVLQKVNKEKEELYYQRAEYEAKYHREHIINLERTTKYEKKKRQESEK